MTIQMFPMIVVEDPGTASAWYRTHLGFESVASLGWYEHLRDASGRELGFLSAGVEGQPSELQEAANGRGFALSFEVRDLEETWRSWGSSQEVLSKPKREPWGQYHFIVRDAAGLVVDLIEAADSAPRTDR